MSTYSCSDCDDGELISDVRQIELAEGETVQILGAGVAVITRITCSNDDCSSHKESEEADEEETPSGEVCGKRGCPKKAGHMGRCRKPRSEEAAK